MELEITKILGRTLLSRYTARSVSWIHIKDFRLRPQKRVGILSPKNSARKVNRAYCSWRYQPVRAQGRHSSRIFETLMQIVSFSTRLASPTLYPGSDLAGDELISRLSNLEPFHAYFFYFWLGSWKSWVFGVPACSVLHVMQRYTTRIGNFAQKRSISERTEH